MRTRSSAVLVVIFPGSLSPGSGVTKPRNVSFPTFDSPRSGSMYVRTPFRAGSNGADLSAVGLDRARDVV